MTFAHANIVLLSLVVQIVQFPESFWNFIVSCPNSLGAPYLVIHLIVGI